MPSCSTTSTPKSSPKSSSFASSSHHFSSPSSSSASDLAKDRLPFSAPGKPPPAPFHRTRPAPSILPHPSSPTNTLIRTIQSLRRNSTVDDPDTVFHVTCTDIRSLYRELRHPKILSGSEVDSLRFDYDPATSTLTLRCMISPIHEAVGHLVNLMKEDMIFDRFLCRAEARHLLINTNGSVALPSSVRGSKFRVAAMKQPDAAFQFADPAARLEAFPRVVFEAAFSQSYESVKDYAGQWLLRSEGAVKLVVVIKLFEGPIEPPVVPGSEDPTPETNDDDPESPASSVSSAFSTASGYTNFLNTADPTLWVGPISGFLELYRYDPATKTVYIDGPRYDLYPTDEQPLPRICLVDLLPVTHIQGDATRSYPIPLHEYRELIALGVRNLALLRRAGESRKRKGRLSDGYVTERSVDEEEEEGEEGEEGEGKEGEGGGKRVRLSV